MLVKKTGVGMHQRRSCPDWIRLVYAVCLAGAAYNHATIVAAHGLDWDYGGLPKFVTHFWTALTFFDALTAGLLFVRPRSGVAMTCVIIVFDVVINAWVGMRYGVDIASFLAQLSFLIFVVFTARRAGRVESSVDI